MVSGTSWLSLVQSKLIRIELNLQLVLLGIGCHNQPAEIFSIMKDFVYNLVTGSTSKVKKALYGTLKTAADCEKWREMVFALQDVLDE